MLQLWCCGIMEALPIMTSLVARRLSFFSLAGKRSGTPGNISHVTLIECGQG